VNEDCGAIRPAILALVLLTIGNRLSVGQSAPGRHDKMIVIGSCSASRGPRMRLARRGQGRAGVFRTDRR